MALVSAGFDKCTCYCVFFDFGAGFFDVSEMRFALKCLFQGEEVSLRCDFWKRNDLEI